MPLSERQVDSCPDLQVIASDAWSARCLQDIPQRTISSSLRIACQEQLVRPLPGTIDSG